MKVLKILAIIIIVLIGISAIIILVNKLRSRSLNKQYVLLGQNVHSQHYVIEEFKVTGKTFMLQSYDNLHPDALQESDALSYLRYDKVLKQIILKTEEYVRDPSGALSNDHRIHLYNFDLDGKMVSHDSAMYRLNRDEHNTILLKDYIAPFQKWKNENEEIYLKHFSMDDLSLSCLNPFTIGGINGSSPCYVWEGDGYFDLHVANDTLRFKSPAGKVDIFFTEKHSYGTDLRYYKLPAALHLKTPAFLLYTPSYEQHRLFIIKPK